MRQAASASDPQQRAQQVTEEKARNLGYKLYIALQTHGGWAQPPGYPVQLLGRGRAVRGHTRPSQTNCCTRTATTFTSPSEGGILTLAAGEEGKS